MSHPIKTNLFEIFAIRTKPAPLAGWMVRRYMG
jgi:hypothetical protein